MPNDENSEFRKLLSQEVARLNLESTRRAVIEERFRIEEMRKLQDNNNVLIELYEVAKSIGPMAALRGAPTTTLLESDGFNHLTRRYRKKEVAKGWVINSLQNNYDIDSLGPYHFKGVLLAASGLMSAFYGHGLLSATNVNEDIEVMYHALWSGPPAELVPSRIKHNDTFFTSGEVLGGLARFAVSRGISI